MALLTLEPQIELPDGTQSTHYDVTYTLEGLRYGFRFYIVNNIVQEYKRWYFDIFDPDTNTNIINGIRFSLGIDMLAFYRYLEGIPPGILALADLQTTKWDAASQSFTGIRGYDPDETGFEDQKYSLVYMTSDEAFG